MTVSLKNLATLIDRLAAKTEGGELDWLEEIPNVFVTKVGSTKIQISVEYSEFDPEADPDYYVNFFQGKSVIDTVSDTELQKYMVSAYSTLRKLYSNARRSARGIAEFADNLLEELEKNEGKR